MKYRDYENFTENAFLKDLKDSEIYYSKTLRISCAYFYAFSISNSCRLLKDLSIKLEFSEDVSYMTVSNLYAK